MDLDRLRQSSFHGQVEGGLSSSSSGGLWAPRSWLRILAKLPHQLWGRCSCLNPVPQERHLLVIGTMEMAAGFWTWLWAASFRGRKKGGTVRQCLGQENGVLCHLSLSLLRIAATSTRSRTSQVKSAANPVRRGKVSGQEAKKG